MEYNILCNLLLIVNNKSVFINFMKITKNITFIKLSSTIYIINSMSVILKTNNVLCNRI